MNIILDINECPSLPHPEPYSGVQTSMLEIQEFIQKTVKLNKQPIVVFERIGALMQDYLKG